MEKLIVSMMRFSSALTMLGVEQMQNSVGLATGKENLDEAMDRFRSALDDFSTAVVGSLDEDKKKTVDSFTKASEDALNQTMDGLNMANMDPGSVVEATTDFVKKTTDSMVDFVSGRAEHAAEAAGEAPKRAAEVLSRARKASTAKSTKAKTK